MFQSLKDLKENDDISFFEYLNSLNLDENTYILSLISIWIIKYPNIEKMDDLIDSKSKPLYSTNIWINDIDNEVNDPHPTIPITNIINIEHYDLWFNFVI